MVIEMSAVRDCLLNSLLAAFVVEFRCSFQCTFLFRTRVPLFQQLDEMEWRIEKELKERSLVGCKWGPEGEGKSSEEEGSDKREVCHRSGLVGAERRLGEVETKN